MYLRDYYQIACDRTNPVGPAMLGLAASYLKEYFPNKSSERKTLERVEMHYITKVIGEVRSANLDQNGRLATGVVVATALLEHHAILNEKFYQGTCWTMLLFPLRANPDPYLDANVIMASGAIFAKTMLPRCSNRSFQQADYSWIKNVTAPKLWKIQGGLGISRGLLYILNLISDGSEVSAHENAFPKIK